MGIVVACRCGQAFEADLDLAGKVVQCPVCRGPIVVPTPPPAKVAAPRDDFTANQALADVSGASYVPRFFSPASRESHETAQSVGTFLVAGVVIFLVVLGLSLGIVGYIRWKGHLATAPLPSPAQPASRPAAAGLAPAASPDAAQPSPTVFSGTGSTEVPQDWSRYEHPTARYSVVLPAPPEVIERTEENLLGKQIFHILKSSQDEHAYEACREFRPYKIAERGEADAYASIAERRADEIEGSIIRSEDLTVDGRPVCDLILQGRVGDVQVRQYLRLIARGDSVLELSCNVPPGKERAAEIGAFLANFKME